VEGSRTRSGRARAARRPPLLVRWIASWVARRYLRRPETADVIATRYRSLRAILGGLLNEWAYRRGFERAPALLSANLEVTSRCNLRCTFCPTGNGTLGRVGADMEPTLFARVLARARPLEFVLLFQWGEPLLHPRFLDLARFARRVGARTLVTTNGTMLRGRRLADLVAAGLDRITLSVDGDAATHRAVRGIPLAETEAALGRLLAARDRGGPRTAVDVSMVVTADTERAAEAFEDRYRGRVDRVQRIPLLTEGRRRTRCREPWRGGLVVLQDGRVTVCCVDHGGELAVGDARRQTLREIWNGPAMRALRRAHASGALPDRCARCAEYPTDAAAPRFASREAVPDVERPRAGDRPA
jgi:radical SAM protein with 4Fe4S-binding SPASM domain